MKKYTPEAPSNASKTNVKNPSNKPKYVSRTTLSKMITSTKGKFFSTTHVDKHNKPRTMNLMGAKPSNELGYITAWSIKDKGWRNVNTQTVTDFKFQGVHYKARK